MSLLDVSIALCNQRSDDFVTEEDLGNANGNMSRAFDDSRFNPIAKRELPNLEVGYDPYLFPFCFSISNFVLLRMLIFAC